MIYQRRDQHCWRASAGTAIVATLAVVGGFLTTTLATASATTTSPTTTSTLPGTDCRASTSGAVLDRTGWVARSNAPYTSADAPQYALDGRLTTRFSTSEPQATGSYFGVDLGAAQAFDELVMASPNSPNDYARGYDVKVWTNAKTWATIATCTGTATPEVVSFPTQTARYVRVVLTAASASYWWSIDEFNLYSNAPATTTTTTSTAPHPTTTTPQYRVQPRVSALTTSVKVHGHAFRLWLSCRKATCSGWLRVYDGRPQLAAYHYRNLRPGPTWGYLLRLNQ